MKVHDYQKLLIRDIIKVWWNLIAIVGVLVAVGEETKWVLEFTAETAAICAILILYIYLRDRPAK